MTQPSRTPAATQNPNGTVQVRRLVGVYHADGGVRGELASWIGARLGNAHCALCDITHGLVRERPDWKACRAALPVPFETLHLDEQDSERRAFTADRTPCVVADTDGGPVMLLGPDDVAACAGSPQCLVETIADAASRRHLTFGD